MIATWLAGKLSGIIIFCIACLSIILIPAVIVQTVRINGISFFGWYAVDGYKPMFERDEKDLVTYRNNQAALQNGLNICNTSVDNIAKAGKMMTDIAQELADQAKQSAEQLRGNISALQSIKSSDEKCPVADFIIQRGLQ